MWLFDIRVPIAEEERRVILDMNSEDMENNRVNAEILVSDCLWTDE